MQDQDQHNLKSNTTLNNYKIIRVLGEGGFGITYLAEDVSLGLEVVIKEYFPNEFAMRSGDSTITAKSKSKGDFTKGMQRFKEEAQTLAKFNHPSIVKILGYFEANDTAYFVMEYEEGIDLSHYLKEKGTPLKQEGILSIIMPILEGLKEVHKHNYLHRDIKPGNMLIRANHSPVLIDFGASKLAMGEASKSITSMLTEGYAPLEQYSTDIKQQGSFSDIYAIAAVIYKMITSEVPPSAQTRSYALLSEDIDSYKPLSAMKLSGFDLNFLKAVDRALSMKAKDRPQDVQEFQADISGRLIQKEKQVEAADKNKDSTGENKKSNKGLIAILAILIVLAGGVLGYLLLNKQNISEDPIVVQKKTIEVPQEIEQPDEARKQAEKEKIIKQAEEERKKAEILVEETMKKAKEENEAKKMIKEAMKMAEEQNIEIEEIYQKSMAEAMERVKGNKKAEEALGNMMKLIDNQKKASEELIKEALGVETARKTVVPKISNHNDKDITIISNKMWQDESYTMEEKMAYSSNGKTGKLQDWDGAVQYCRDLVLEGYNDWRLPMINELQELYKHKSELSNVVDNRYWSSTPYLSEKDIVWLLNFDDLTSMNYLSKSNSYYVRCVRELKKLKPESIEKEESAAPKTLVWNNEKAKMIVLNKLKKYGGAKKYGYKDIVKKHGNISMKHSIYGVFPFAQSAKEYRLVATSTTTIKHNNTRGSGVARLSFFVFALTDGEWVLMYNHINAGRYSHFGYPPDAKDVKLIDVGKDQVALALKNYMSTQGYGHETITLYLIDEDKTKEILFSEEISSDDDGANDPPQTSWKATLEFDKKGTPLYDLILHKVGLENKKQIDVKVVYKYDGDKYVKQEQQVKHIVSSIPQCAYFTVFGVKQLNIRDKPGKPSKVVGMVNQDDIVCIYDFTGKWGRSDHGWISGKYLKPSRIENICKEMNQYNKYQAEYYDKYGDIECDSCTYTDLFYMYNKLIRNYNELYNRCQSTGYGITKDDYDQRIKSLKTELKKTRKSKEKNDELMKINKTGAARDHYSGWGPNGDLPGPDYRP